MNLDHRIKKLETATAQPWPFVARFIFRGRSPTPDEQSQIDEAKRQGGFVIIRRLFSPKA